MSDVPPLLKMLVGELRRLRLDVEYRGQGDQLHLVGDTRKADEDVMNAMKAARKRILDVLKPLWEQGGGRPVRLPQDAANGPEPARRDV